MSEHPALSSADQQTVQAEIHRRLQANRIKTKNNALSSVQALVFGAASLLVWPPASVAFAAAALVFGGGLLGNAATKRVLQSVENEVGTEGFIDELERRANNLASRVPDLIGPLAVVGTAILSPLMMFMAVPVVAGLVGVFLVGCVASWWAHRSAQKTAVEVNAFAQHQPSAAVAVAPASQANPGAPAILRSRKADFAGAAGTNQVPDTIYPRKQPSPAVFLGENNMTGHMKAGLLPGFDEAVCFIPRVERHAETVVLEHPVHLREGRIYPGIVVVVLDRPAVAIAIADQVRRIGHDEIYRPDWHRFHDIDAVAPRHVIH